VNTFTPPWSEPADSKNSRRTHAVLSISLNSRMTSSTQIQLEVRQSADDGDCELMVGNRRATDRTLALRLMRCPRRKAALLPAKSRWVRSGMSFAFPNGVDIRIGAAALLTVVLIPSQAAAGQPSDEDREERATYSPLTSSERAAWVAGEIASPGALSRAAFTSAWMMKANSPKEWPRNAPGYGRRFGDAQAVTAISSSIEAGLGTFWSEDPRYFRSGRRERWARVRHAVVSVALAHRRDGHRAPAWGRFAGSVAGNVIENTWLPPSATTRSRTTARVATGFAGQLAANLWTEFWPDLRRRLPRRRLRGVDRID
jgi:hypothetical protein